MRCTPKLRIRRPFGGGYPEDGLYLGTDIESAPDFIQGGDVGDRRNLFHERSILDFGLHELVRATLEICSHFIEAERQLIELVRTRRFRTGRDSHTEVAPCELSCGIQKRVESTEDEILAAGPRDEEYQGGYESNGFELGVQRGVRGSEGAHNRHTDADKRPAAIPSPQSGEGMQPLDTVFPERFHHTFAPVPEGGVDHGCFRDGFGNPACIPGRMDENGTEGIADRQYGPVRGIPPAGWNGMLRPGRSGQSRVSTAETVSITRRESSNIGWVKTRRERSFSAQIR